MLGGASQSVDGDVGRFCRGSLGLCGDPQWPPIPGEGSGAVLGSLAWEILVFFLSLIFNLKPKQGVLLPGAPSCQRYVLGEQGSSFPEISQGSSGLNMQCSGLRAVGRC